MLTADPELPPLLEQRFITAILENREDDLKSPKKEIQSFFRENYEQNKRAEYLKYVYPDRFTELIVDGTRIGYKAMDDGFLMWEGAYLTRTKESVFSWGIVAELTGNLIEQGTYYYHPKVTPPPSYEEQQISFMDEGYAVPDIDDDSQVSFYSQPELPQQVIDEALCIGFNDRNSRLIICAYFMKDKPLEDNAAFLQKKYGTNGAGLFINDREYAVWYDPQGIRVSTGRSAQKRHATLLSWTQAAKRIRELLDLGRYMPQSELDRVQDFERKEIADSLIFCRREFSEAAKEAGYLPLTTLAYSVKGSFPESEAQMKALLEDPATLSQLVDEWTLFASVHASDRSILRSRWYEPKAILQRLEDLQREPIIFTAAEGYDPQRQFYISDDELDKLVLSGNGDYRLDVYAFFANHSDTKEREKYLSHYHGEYSGSHNGNDNTTYTYKQLHFSHGGISQPHAQVTLTWNKVLRRVESLMQSGKWLSEADRAEMADYELKQQGKIFTKLMDIISSEENIRLAYRNIKRNGGSNTAGTDKQTIKIYKTVDTEKIKLIYSSEQGETNQLLILKNNTSFYEVNSTNKPYFINDIGYFIKQRKYQEKQFVTEDKDALSQYQSIICFPIANNPIQGYLLIEAQQPLNDLIDMNLISEFLHKVCDKIKDSWTFNMPD